MTQAYLWMKSVIDLAASKNCNLYVNWCSRRSSHCSLMKKTRSLISEDLGNNEAYGVGVVAAFWLPHYGNMLACDWGDSTIDICDRQHKDLTHP